MSMIQQGPAQVLRNPCGERTKGLDAGACPCSRGRLIVLSSFQISAPHHHKHDRHPTIRLVRHPRRAEGWSREEMVLLSLCNCFVNLSITAASLKRCPAIVLKHISQQTQRKHIASSSVWFPSSVKFWFPNFPFELQIHRQLSGSLQLFLKWGCYPIGRSESVSYILNRWSRRGFSR